MSADNVAPAYQFGFGNAFESEALPGALPRGRFSPQQPAYGLHTEKFSASAFTAPRATNRRTWFYRIQPSVVHGGFTAIEPRAWCSAPIRDAVASPNPLRWDPFALPQTPCDFIDGLTTIAANGDPAAQTGIGVHVYLANRSMDTRYAYNADGELLICAAARRARDSHRMRHTLCRAGQHLRDSPRDEIPRGAHRRHRPRLCV